MDSSNGVVGMGGLIMGITNGIIKGVGREWVVVMGKCR